MQARKARKKTAFVPRIVFRATVLGSAVVPVCVAACGGEVAQSRGDAGSDAEAFGVALLLADSGAADGGGQPDGEFIVACCFSVGAIAFDGGGPTDAGLDAGSVGVAADAFSGPFVFAAFVDAGDAGVGREASTFDGPMGVGVSAFSDGGDASPHDGQADAPFFNVAAPAFEAGH